jgi:nicotinamide phosphoribosyltransferase
MKRNPLFATDFYKTGHIAQYPPNTSLVYANLTARSARHAPVSSRFDDKVVLFGLQGFIFDYLVECWNTEFFQRPKDEVVETFRRRMDRALGQGVVGVAQVAALHDLGYLPLHIKALPEGSRVNIKVPFVTIQNTEGAFYWLTNYIETALSAELWKSISAATIAYEYRRTLDYYVALTGSSPHFAAWQCHDFSMRGMSGIEDAARTGAAHLLCHFGTDTIPALDYLEQFYMADVDNELVGGSVPATEHSVMCMGGRDDERGTFRRLVAETYPSGVVSIVSDTWDFWNVVTVLAAELKDVILAREPNDHGVAKVVFRPDSGDPVKIICGDLDAPHGSPARKGAVRCLWEIFGGTVTDQGFRTLHERVGLIYGDSITLARQEQILSRLAQMGFSAGNVVFGIGSYTYQHMTRDSFGMAVKATFGVVDGDSRELFKDPATDDGTKKSARGLLRVERQGDDYVLFDRQTRAQEQGGELRTVFMNSAAYAPQSLAQIRRRLAGEIDEPSALTAEAA